MGDNTSIEWTDATWNPVRGCSKISPGCKHCYAETLAERFRGVRGHPFEHGFDLRLVPEKLAQPLSWARPRRVFVNSMSDLFHEDVSDDYIAAVFRVMQLADWHTYQVLTKRAERMRDFVGRRRWIAGCAHIWLGVSVEDRAYGLPRIRQLRRTRAKVRFLSIEPLLEHLGPLNFEGIHWIIVGGESGGGARGMQESWVIPIRDTCSAHGIPFFFKQWGGPSKGRGGRLLQGRTHDDTPAVGAPQTPHFAERRRRMMSVLDGTAFVNGHA